MIWQAVAIMIIRTRMVIMIIDIGNPVVVMILGIDDIMILMS
jgi:hypothetical protein